MKTIAYNQQMLEIIIADIWNEFGKYGKLNITYEKTSKEKTYKQMGFLFAALIDGITNFFQDCGFNVDADDVRYKLYEDVSKIIPEMVIDNVLFNGKPRIKHLGDMDRALCSKFIDGIFTLLDQDPLYAGIQLHPSIYYNWAFHLDPEEVKVAQQTILPEKDEDYLEYVRTLPCICCGIQHRSQAHHTKTGDKIGLAMKTEDARAIPLCAKCHLGIAHGTGFKDAMKWLPYDLDTFTKLCYLRWINKNN